MTRVLHYSHVNIIIMSTREREREREREITRNLRSIACNSRYTREGEKDNLCANSLLACFLAS